jgi:hypothetical protein
MPEIYGKAGVGIDDSQVADAKADAAEAPEWAKKLDAKVDACMARMDSMDVFKDSKRADAGEDMPEKKLEKEGEEEGKPAETAADKKKADSESGEKEEKEMEGEAKCDSSGAVKLSKADRAKLTPGQLAQYKAGRDKAKAQIALDAARADATQFKTQVEELKKLISAQGTDLSMLHGHVHISDADRATMAEIQSRADSVHQLFGVSQHAPNFQPGETPLAYRRRLVNGLKQYSDKWKTIELASADEKLMALAENDIYADAAKHASHPGDIPNGTLRAVIKEDARTGRKITEWVGDKSVWMDQFKAPAQLMVSIKKDFRND